MRLESGVVDCRLVAGLVVVIEPTSPIGGVLVAKNYPQCAQIERDVFHPQEGRHLRPHRVRPTQDRQEPPHARLPPSVVDGLICGLPRMFAEQCGTLWIAA